MAPDPTKPNTTDTVSNLGQSAYANVLSEQASLILLYEELIRKIKEKDSDFDLIKKKYINFSTDRCGEIGQFHISKELTKTTDMKVFFHQSTTPLLSSLVPSIKLYKTIYNFGSKARSGREATKDHKIYDWRIPFDTIPTKFSDGSKEYSSEYTEQDTYTTGEESGRLHGVGIKSFNYEYVGTNPAEVNTNIKVSITFFFQNIADLVKDISITKDDPRLTETPSGDFITNAFRYSDLVNNSSRTKTEEWTRSLVLNEFYYRIKAVVGYAPVSKKYIQEILTGVDFTNYLNLIETLTDLRVVEEQRKAHMQKVKKEFTFDSYVEKFMRAIESARVIMFLTPYSHNLNFNEDGTLEMQVEYHATIDKVLNSEQADVMKISNAYQDYITKKERLDELLNAKKTRINELQNQGCSEKLINEQIKKQFGDDAKNFALKARTDDFLTSRYNLYASLYENIVGLQNFRSSGKSSIFLAKINSDILALQKEGETFSVGDADPEGKALKYSAFARLNALESDVRISEVTAISKDSYKNEKEIKDLFFLDREAENLLGTENSEYTEEAASASNTGSISDVVLFKAVNEKKVLLLTDYNSRYSKANEKIKKTLSENGAKIVEHNITTPISEFSFNPSFFKTTFNDNNKYDLVISFASSKDAFMVEDTGQDSDSIYANFTNLWGIKYVYFLNSLLNQEGKFAEPTSGIYLDSTNYAKNNFYIITPSEVPKEPDSKVYPIEAYQDEVRKPYDINKIPNNLKTYNNRVKRYNDGLKTSLKALIIRSNITKYIAWAKGASVTRLPAIKSIGLLAGWNTDSLSDNTGMGAFETVFFGDGLSTLYPRQPSLPNDSWKSGLDGAAADTSGLDNHIITAKANAVNTASPSIHISEQEGERIHDELMQKIKLNNALTKKEKEDLTIEFAEALKINAETEKSIIQGEENKNAKLSMTDGNKFANVKFVMLGDVLDSALGCLNIINPREVVPRIILGSINIKIPRRYIKDTESTLKELTINLADVPISIDLFQKFLLNKMVKPQRSNYTAMSFIKDVISDLIVPSVSPSLFGESAYLNNSIRFSTFGITVPAKDDGSDPIFNIPPSRINRVPLPSFDSQKLKDLSVLNSKTIVTPNIKKTVDYLFIYCSSQFPNSISGDIYNDEENKVFHLRIGTDSGIVKTIKFSATDNRFYREAVAAQEGNLKTPLIRQVYDAEVKLFGNNIFRPGDFVYIEPIFGYTNLEVDLQDKIGLGGYYQIINVRTSINENIFETSLKCTFFAHKKANGVPEAAGQKQCSIQSDTPIAPVPEKPAGSN